MAQIFIFGASTECGAWDKEGGWVDRLKRYIYDSIVIASNYKKDYIVYNLGIDGDDSRGLLKRIKEESTRRMWEGSENIFIISIATNDTIYSLKTNKLRTSPDKYRENLIEVIKIVKKYSSKIVLKSPLPIDQKLVDPIPWLLDHSYKSEYIEQYNKILGTVARKEKVLFINLYKEFNNKNWKKMLVDGVHANTKGHEKIFQRVKDFLIDNKII